MHLILSILSIIVVVLALYTFWLGRKINEIWDSIEMLDDFRLSDVDKIHHVERLDNRVDIHHEMIRRSNQRIEALHEFLNVEEIGHSMLVLKKKGEK